MILCWFYKYEHWTKCSSHSIHIFLLSSFFLSFVRSLFFLRFCRMECHFILQLQTHIIHRDTQLHNFYIPFNAGGNSKCLMRFSYCRCLWFFSLWNFAQFTLRLPANANTINFVGIQNFFFLTVETIFNNVPHWTPNQSQHVEHIIIKELHQHHLLDLAGKKMMKKCVVPNSTALYFPNFCTFFMKKKQHEFRCVPSSKKKISS